MWTVQPDDGDKQRMAFLIRALERVGEDLGYPGPYTEEMVLRLALLSFAVDASEMIHGGRTKFIN